MDGLVVVSSTRVVWCRVVSPHIDRKEIYGGGRYGRHGRRHGRCSLRQLGAETRRDVEVEQSSS